MNSPSPATTSPERRLAHELHVHQIELETQNAELRRTQSDLAAARDRYLDLFDFAPVGCFTLDQDGGILECNLTGAEMLGVLRNSLKGARLSRFIQPGDTERWDLYLRQVLRGGAPQRIDLSLRHGDQADPWFGQVDSQLISASARPGTLRVAMTDITGRMRADAERRVAAIDASQREVERQRIALQLHEDLGQRLSALKMDLAGLSQASPPTEFRERVGGMRASLDDTLASVRTMTLDLRPPMLDDLGLAAAIEWLVRDTARCLGLPLSLSLAPETGVLDDPTRLAIYRFVQEAMVLLLHDTGGAELHVGTRYLGGQFVLALSARLMPEAVSTRAAIDPQAVLILEHRARLMGGRLAVDVPHSRGGWFGLELSLPAVPHGSITSAGGSAP
jgi:PAS domain S-box-containing protein